MIIRKCVLLVTVFHCMRFPFVLILACQDFNYSAKAKMQNSHFIISTSARASMLPYDILLQNNTKIDRSMLTVLLLLLLYKVAALIGTARWLDGLLCCCSRYWTFYHGNRLILHLFRNTGTARAAGEKTGGSTANEVVVVLL